MGERDRFQSQYDRERGRYDSDDDYHEQRRRQAREWRPGEEYRQDTARDRERYAGYYNERQYGSRGVDEREQGSAFGSEESRYRNEPRYEGNRRYGSEPGFAGYDRERERRVGRYEQQEGRYGSPYTAGHYDDSARHGSRYNTQAEPHRGSWEERTQRQRDWQERGRDDESFGEQLREAGQRIARTVKRAFRGPKGYKRSDERIKEDVSDRLGEHEYLDCSEVEVNVSNGEVTLTGLVRTRQEKFLVEEIADDVSGVNDVHNQLRVKREQSNMGLAETVPGTGPQPGGEAARTRNARA